MSSNLGTWLNFEFYLCACVHSKFKSNSQLVSVKIWQIWNAFILHKPQIIFENVKILYVAYIYNTIFVVRNYFPIESVACTLESGNSITMTPHGRGGISINRKFGSLQQQLVRADNKGISSKLLALCWENHWWPMDLIWRLSTSRWNLYWLMVYVYLNQCVILAITRILTHFCVNLSQQKS